MEELTISGHKLNSAALLETFDTSGGPGGQHANRNETAVRLKLDIAAAGFPEDITAKLIERLGEIVEVVSSDSRSQFRNRALARQRIKQQIEDALVEPQTRRPTRATRASSHRRVKAKKARGMTKRLRRKPDPDD